MMTAEQIKTLINELPNLIIYIIPGYIALWINGFVLSKKLENDVNIFIKSVVISYIIVTPLRLINNWKWLAFISIIFAITVGYFVSRLILSEWFCHILKRLGINKSFHTNFWNDVVDLNKGNWVRVYIPNEEIIYTGMIREFEEKENTESSFLVLSKYSVFDFSSNLIDDQSLFEESRVIINTKDISRTEIFYHNESKKL